MWKKIAAIATVVSVLAVQSMSAFAGSVFTDTTGGLIKDISVDNMVKDATGALTIKPNLPLTGTVTTTVAADVSVTVKDAVTNTVWYTPSVSYNADSTVATFASESANIAVGNYVLSVVAGDKVDGDPVKKDIPYTVSTIQFTSGTVAKAVFNPLTSSTTFSWSADQDAAYQISIYNVATEALVVTYPDKPLSTFKSYTWDGIVENADGTLSYVAPGDYTATVLAVGEGEGNEATKGISVKVDYTLPSVCGEAYLTGNLIEDLCASDSTWDPSDEELDVEWEFAEDIDEMVLTATNLTDGTDLDDPLWDDEEMDSGKYDDEDGFTWDGLDEDDEYISEGFWAIDLTVKKGTTTETVSFYVKVSYEKPEVSDVFVTKTSFDASAGETTSVVFKVDQESVVSVSVVEAVSGKEVVELWEEEEVSKKAWYSVEWDGMDDDGDEVDEDEDYKFEITVANVANEDVDTTVKSESVTVEEDTVSSSRANVTNDYITPVILPKTGEYAVVSYKIDEPAEVTVEIFKGEKSSNPEIVLEDGVTKKAGTYSVKWDGEDEDGKTLDKDEQYSYRVTAKTLDSTKTDKERGIFVVGTEGNVKPEPKPQPTPVSEGCEVYSDMRSTSPYCEAVAWATEAGIMEGNPNGTFEPYAYVNRVEALKVALTAFDAPLLLADGTNLGFSDVNPVAWYVTYLKTGKVMGMVSGYAGTDLVKPSEKINRVEFLKYAFEAADSFYFPSCNFTYYSDVKADKWYSKYVCAAHDYDLFDTVGGMFLPAEKMTRGEVADVLFRMYEGALIK